MHGKNLLYLYCTAECVRFENFCKEKAAVQQKAHSSLEIIKLLADLDAKLELQVAEDLLDEAIDLIGSEGLLAGLEVQAESHALLVSTQLFAAVDVEQLHLSQLLAGALHLGDEGAALHAFGSNQGQIALDRANSGIGV